MTGIEEFELGAFRAAGGGMEEGSIPGGTARGGSGFGSDAWRAWCSGLYIESQSNLGCERHQTRKS